MLSRQPGPEAKTSQRGEPQFATFRARLSRLLWPLILRMAANFCVTSRRCQTWSRKVMADQKTLETVVDTTVTGLTVDPEVEVDDEAPCAFGKDTHASATRSAHLRVGETGVNPCSVR